MMDVPFDEALAALDAGDLEALRALVAAHPSLVRARTNLDPSHGYFMGATLLHHVAGNPDRGRLENTKPALPSINPFKGTPLGWAEHNNQQEVAHWLRSRR
jgi:hypothetical protein